MDAGRLMYEEKTGIRACRPWAYWTFVILCAGAGSIRVSTLAEWSYLQIQIPRRHKHKYKHGCLCWWWGFKLFVNGARRQRRQQTIFSRSDVQACFTINTHSLAEISFHPLCYSGIWLYLLQSWRSFQISKINTVLSLFWRSRMFFFVKNIGHFPNRGD